MRLEIYALELPATTVLGPATNGAGAALKVADHQDKWLQITGLTGTADLEGTINGTYVKLITGVANGIVEVPQGVVYVRMLRTGNGAGTAHIVGRARAGE